MQGSSASINLPLSNDFDTDYSTLAAQVEILEAEITGFQAPCDRTQSTRERVRQIIMLQNDYRIRFLSKNVKQVYRALTRDLQDYVTVTELCSRASLKYPILVPSAEQMELERVLPLNEREGRELILSSFVSEFLRDSQCGRHLLASMRQPSAFANGQLEEFSRHGVVHFGVVKVERQGSAAVITLENKDCLNAEDLELLTQLELAVDIVLLSPNISVGVVRGGVMDHPKHKGRRIFCAGMNLRKLSLGQIPFVEYLLSREMGLMEKIRRGLWLPGALSGHRLTHEKPWVGVVEGFAIGGGLQMLLNFDKIIASEEVYFSLPATQEGIIPGLANFRLSRIVGKKLARRMILFGEKVAAVSEEGRLLCDDVVNPNEIESAAHYAVQELSGTSVAANRHMLNISDEPERDLLNYLAEFSIIQAERSLSNDVISKVKNW